MSDRKKGFIVVCGQTVRRKKVPGDRKKGFIVVCEQTVRRKKVPGT